MKYLQPKRKGVKIKISPTNVITVPMYNMLRVNEAKLEISVLALTGATMLYQNSGIIKTKKKYVDDILLMERDFKFFDDFDFISL